MTEMIKNRKRVTDYGEVFTTEREVNAMLDLVKQETDRVDSRFLEPACGDGNFLAEILRRKLAAARRRAIPPRKRKPIPMEFEKQSVIAVASLRVFLMQALFIAILRASNSLTAWKAG